MYASALDGSSTEHIFKTVRDEDGNSQGPGRANFLGGRTYDLDFVQCYCVSMRKGVWSAARLILREK